MASHVRASVRRSCGSKPADLSQLSHKPSGLHRTQAESLDIRRILTCGYGLRRTGRTLPLVYGSDGQIPARFTPIKPFKSDRCARVAARSLRASGPLHRGDSGASIGGLARTELLPSRNRWRRNAVEPAVMNRSSAALWAFQAASVWASSSGDSLHDTPSSPPLRLSAMRASNRLVS